MAFIPKIASQLVPTTINYDVTALQNTDVNSAEFKQLIIKLYQSINNISVALNNKHTAFYTDSEFVTGGRIDITPNPPPAGQPMPQGFEYTRSYYIENLAPGVTNIPLGLTAGNNWIFTDIYGVANDGPNNRRYPLPFVSAGATPIEVYCTNTNLVITNGTAFTFPNAIVTIRYVKLG